MFIHDIGAIHNLSGNAVKFLMYIVEKMAKDGRIITSKFFKKEASERLKVGVRTVDNLMTELVKSDLVVREVTNVYMMSPYFIGYGDEQSINYKRSIYLEIKYSNEGRSIKTVFVNEDGSISK